MTMPSSPHALSASAPSGGGGARSVYRLGARGPAVRQIQAALLERRHYSGTPDGVFGEGTRSAVRAFQRAAGITPDGIVGAATWNALLGDTAPRVSTLVGEPLAVRCLALTATFETGSPPPDCFSVVAGDFDGQGISYGALQWNVGQGTLQSLVRDVDAHAPGVIDEVLGAHAAELRALFGKPRAEQLAWARSIQEPVRHRLHEPWRTLLRTLGRRRECQGAQVRAAAAMFEEAKAWCRAYGLRSQRAAALMFDVRVQNGSISKATAEQIRADVAALPAGGSADAREEAVLTIIANRRAEVAKAKWVEDVRRRKLTIARGRGTVHGITFDLGRDYGIGLAPYES